MTTNTQTRRRAPERPYRPKRNYPGNGRRSRPGSDTARATPPRPKAKSILELALDEAAATAAPQADFGSLGIPPVVVDKLAGRGITDPTEVQRRTIPDALAGRDILGRAQTGSGKTLAFGLPLISTLARQQRPASPGHPRALVLAPTRELAQQVADALSGLDRDLSVLAIYGGASMDRQLKALRRGVDIVVATPGRLEDHMRRGTCSLSRVSTLVIDEADHMADLGFLPAVTRILEATPADGQRMLFSATLDRGVERVALDHLRDPAIHAASVDMGAVATMEHKAFTIDPDHKLAVAAQIAGRHGRTLIFVRTKHGADRLAKQLQREGIATEAIHGNRSQAQRQRALEEFATGRRPVLVATDVAARGIHVDGIDLVVHFDPPADHKDYLHRSGRTARAGESGIVLSLLLPHEQKRHRSMHAETPSEHNPVRVDPDHPAVAELAAGGTPIIITAREPRPTRDRSPSGPRGRRNDRPYRGNQRRGR